MLYRYSEVFRGLVLVSDLSLVAAAWLAAYALRFHTGWQVPYGNPGFGHYALALVGIVPLFGLALRSRGLYRPLRTGSLLSEWGAVIGASSMGVVLVLAADATARTYLSRGVIFVFWGLSIVGVAGSRTLIRGVLRHLRRLGYNQRYALVMGAGELAEQVIESVHAHPEAGLQVLGVLTDDLTKQARSVQGTPVLGGYAAIKSVLSSQRVDQVIIALPRVEAAQVQKILADLDDEVVSVKLVPDLLGVMTVQSRVEELDGLPVINLRESPLLGWAAVQKRVFDVVVTAGVMALLSPLFAAVILGVLGTSGRPIFYAQKRMGLDGRVFELLKFRSMTADAERETGPVWTMEDDPRRTRLGAWLRRHSLDELPQLWNVLRGDMSLVGPRPERPVFIEQFRREIPGYMLRHKVKAGLTGWAQIHGWRGNTSLHERVEHDIYYIQNWSLGQDIRILLVTLWRGFRNAY
jgi:exopolysaccharide biosynthesis polyprenyl glycosylphosphotransferase